MFTVTAPKRWKTCNRNSRKIKKNPTKVHKTWLILDHVFVFLRQSFDRSKSRLSLRQENHQRIPLWGCCLQVQTRLHRDLTKILLNRLLFDLQYNLWRFSDNWNILWLDILLRYKHHIRLGISYNRQQLIRFPVHQQTFRQLLQILVLCVCNGRTCNKN